MKRTLVEVFCGLAALVLMVSFHHQIARLERQQHDVTEIEQKLDIALPFTSRAYVLIKGRVALTETSAQLAARPRLSQLYFDLAKEPTP